MLDLKDSGPQNNRGYKYVLVVIDKFRKFGGTVPSESKIAQTIKDSFEKFFITSRSKTNLTERDFVQKKFLNKIFTDLSNKNNNQRSNRNTSTGAVFAERFNRNTRNLLKKPVFGKVKAFG